MNIQRRVILAATLVAAGLATPSIALAQKKIVLGFSPDRRRERLAHRQHRVDQGSAAKDAGIDLKFSDAQQKQENQIKAIRSFIAQKVDVIAFSPVVETGWDTVLQEAKAAKHPRDPHRPRRRLEGHDPVRHLHRLRLRRGRPQGRPAGC